jgi:biotin carboxyl carrier protein
MKLTVEIDGESREVLLKMDGALVLAEVDGRSYRIEARVSRPGVQLLLADNHVYECRIAADAARGASREVHIGSRAFAVTITDLKRLRAGQNAGAQADAVAQLIAPMPGKVVRVLVEQGTEVAAGDPVVVVEAMKMQNEMKSPRAGTVTALHVKTGDTVNAGEVLAVIE